MVRLALASAVAVFVLSACGTGGGGGTDCPSAATDPALACPTTPTATSFKDVYASIKNDCIECHTKGPPEGSGLFYGDYSTEAAMLAATVDKQSAYAGSAKTLKVVQANALDNSTLYLKVLGRSKSSSCNNVGGKMPNNGKELTQAQKDLIKNWICSGAKP